MVHKFQNFVLKYVAHKLIGLHLHDLLDSNIYKMYEGWHFYLHLTQATMINKPSHWSQQTFSNKKTYF